MAIADALVQRSDLCNPQEVSNSGEPSAGALLLHLWDGATFGHSLQKLTGLVRMCQGTWAGRRGRRQGNLGRVTR